MNLKKLAGAMSFAHLLGLPTSAAAAEEDDKEKKDEAARAEDDKQREGESDEDYAKRMEEKDKDDEAARKAEDDEKKEGDDTDSKKGKRADDDGEDDDSMKKGASRERERCKAIVAFGIKNGCARQAGIFAFDTDMTAKQAIAALEAGAIDGRRGSSLASRMADTRIPNVGDEGGAAGPDASTPAGNAKALADQIIAAGMKRRNEKA